MPKITLKRECDTCGNHYDLEIEVELEADSSVKLISSPIEVCPKCGAKHTFFILRPSRRWPSSETPNSK
jgi:DNA-directed RNA polymerase subunit M/transcription elongation factor TFIIS